MKKGILLLLATLTVFSVFAQSEITTAIRGRVVDKQSDFPLPGVAVVLLEDGQLRGVSTDLDGYFRIENVRPGRASIRVSFIGYEPQELNNLLVT